MVSIFLLSCSNVECVYHWEVVMTILCVMKCKHVRPPWLMISHFSPYDDVFVTLHTEIDVWGLLLN